MTLTILGSGTCGSGIPNISDRQPPGYLVEWDDTRLLLDCSEAIRFRIEAAGIDYASIHHIAISHSHPDHFALVHFIQSVFCKGIWGGEPFKNEHISIYCPDHIATNFDTYWAFHLSELGTEKYPWPTLDIIGMSSGAASKNIEDAKLIAQPVYHGFGKVDALGYRLETPEGILAYSGDAGMCDSLVELARDADIFLCEASARIDDERNAYEYGHLNPRQAGAIAKEAQAKKLILTHYTGLDSDADMIAAVQSSGYEADVHIAKDGDVVTV